MIITKDILWKGIIEDLFDDFLWYFFPDFAENEVDFKQKFEFLDKELDSLMPENKKGKRYADKLVKIPIKDKKIRTKYLLLHIEIQGYKDDDFAERMFEYYYRIRDKWNIPIFTLVLYTDENIDFQPISFHESCGETTLSYHFKTFKLLEKSEIDLNIDKNPFSIVMKTAYNS
ncbi:MAG: hypothetical protein EAZ44_06480, partial [Cytophagia bacterium]